MLLIAIPFVLEISSDACDKQPQCLVVWTGIYIFGERSTLLMTLKCRPRKRDHLNRHFEDSTIGRLSPENFTIDETLTKGNMTYSKYEFTRKYFEIGFDPYGIAEYIFEKEDITMNPFAMIRMIASQLSDGMKLEVGVKNFLYEELFTIGRYPTYYQIICFYDGCKKANLNLTSLIHWELKKKMVLLIAKNRFPNECLPPTFYYLGTRYTYSVVHTNYEDELISSMSNILITTDCFVSETLNTVDIYDEDKNKVGMALDRIRVTLESINPTQDCIKTMVAPNSADVVLTNSSNFGII